jgi:amino-acid N-acetyltransferase
MDSSIPVPPPPPTVRAAADADLPAVYSLLTAVALPLDGLADFFPAGYAVAIGPESELLGVAGIEVHGNQGLLRSVAVSPRAQGRGIGADLARDRLAWAAGAGLAGVHLLTTTASPYFARLGFATVDRAELPAAIRASVEFRQACPETAVAMSLTPVVAPVAARSGRGRAQPSTGTGA